MTAPPQGLRHDVVICTKDRAGDLEHCLASLAAQELRPAVVWVIDASGDDASEAVARAAPSPLDVRYCHTEPSTTRQRNIGIESSEADVVHFLDDDVILEPGYLGAIDAVYRADPAAQVLGVGGLPTNLPEPRARRGLRAADQGRVLRSGRGIPVLRTSVDLDVDWLSGCCMSFRRTALERERFDADLVGYALGEDLDLSYRVRQHGRLVVTPAARLVHLESPVNRWSRRRWGRTDVTNRARRVATGVGAYRWSAFWLDGLAQLALWSVRGLRPGGGDARALARGLAEGLVATVRHPPR